MIQEGEWRLDERVGCVIICEPGEQIGCAAAAPPGRAYHGRRWPRWLRRGRWRYREWWVPPWTRWRAARELRRLRDADNRGVTRRRMGPVAGGRLLPADRWLEDPEFCDIAVVDPDGWDRRPDRFEASWAEPITREEMRMRLLASTISWAWSGGRGGDGGGLGG